MFTKLISGIVVKSEISFEKVSTVFTPCDKTDNILFFKQNSQCTVILQIVVSLETAGSIS